MVNPFKQQLKLKIAVIFKILILSTFFPSVSLNNEPLHKVCLQTDITFLMPQIKLI